MMYFRDRIDQLQADADNGCDVSEKLFSLAEEMLDHIEDTELEMKNILQELN